MTFPPFVQPLQDEELLLVTEPSLFNYASKIAVSVIAFVLGLCALVAGSASACLALLGLLLLVVALVVAAYVAIITHASRYVVTDKRVITKRGLISVSLSEVRVSDIRGVNLRKSVIGTIFNYGTVLIGTAATSGTEIAMVGISNPDKVIELINSKRKA